MDCKHHFVALVRTKSHALTFRFINDALMRETQGNIRVTVVDLSAFELAGEAGVGYEGPGKIIRPTLESFGIRKFSRGNRINLLLNGGPLAMNRVKKQAHKLMESLQPSVISMCRDAFYIEYALLLSSRQTGAKSLLVQEGPFMSLGTQTAQSPLGKFRRQIREFMKKAGLLPNLPLPGFAGHDAIAVTSEYYKNLWIRGGVKDETIHVAGTPRYDTLATSLQKIQNRPRGYTRQPYRIIVIVQPLEKSKVISKEAAESVQRVTAEGLVAIAEKLPVEITLRLHPKSDLADITVFHQVGLKDLNIQEPLSPLVDVFPNYDLAIGFYSSGVLEAVVSGLPAICIRIPRAAFFNGGEADKMKWIEDTGIPCASDSEEFTSACSQILADQRFTPNWDYIEAQLGAINGNASQRVANVILDLFPAA